MLRLKTTMFDVIDETTTLNTHTHTPTHKHTYAYTHINTDRQTYTHTHEDTYKYFLFTVSQNVTWPGGVTVRHNRANMEVYTTGKTGFKNIATNSSSWGWFYTFVLYLNSKYMQIY